MVECSVRDVERASSDVAIAGDRDVSQGTGRRSSFRRLAREPLPAPPVRGGSQKSGRNKKFTVFGILRRIWIPLVILAVIAAGTFTVTRLDRVFGSEKRPSYADTPVNDIRPFNPKHLTYEVFGPPGTVATISYFDVNADPQRLEGAALPWSLEFETSEATAVGSVVAQGDSDSIGCRIVVDGEVKAQRISNEVNAFTFCLLKNA